MNTGGTLSDRRPMWRDRGGMTTAFSSMLPPP